MTDDNDDERRWIYDEEHGLSYDPDRWDPETAPMECQVCGSDLRGAGDRSTVGQHCPDCNVSVWIS